MSADSIGCSLAEAAESMAYENYLSEASKDAHPGLHVVYINTSLRTKAQSHVAVPTITCTSSNVVNTVLTVSTCIRFGKSCRSRHTFPKSHAVLHVIALPQ